MPFVIETKGFDIEIKKLVTMGDRLMAVLEFKTNWWLRKIQEKILEGLGGSGALKSRRGDAGLAGTVELIPARRTRGAVRGSVQSLAANQAASSHGPNPYPYGMVQELGGDHFFDIVGKPYLAFDWGGKHVVTRAVRNRYPLEKRSWFYPEAVGMEDAIARDLLESLQRELAK